VSGAEACCSSRSGLSRGNESPLSLVEPPLQPNQEVMGQDHQCHVVVPAAPEAALVVIQTQFVLRFGKAALNGPAHPTGPNQGEER
jgi:hypothetical protein